MHSRLLDHFFDILGILSVLAIFIISMLSGIFRKVTSLEVANDSGESGQLHAIPLFIKS